MVCCMTSVSNQRVGWANTIEDVGFGKPQNHEVLVFVEQNGFQRLNDARLGNGVNGLVHGETS